MKIDCNSNCQGPKWGRSKLPADLRPQPKKPAVFFFNSKLIPTKLEDEKKKTYRIKN